MSSLEKHISKLVDSEVSNQQRVHYRLIYLHPNMHSNEALTVGLVLDDRKGSKQFVGVDAPEQQEIMTRLLGIQLREQTTFALNILKDQIGPASSNLEDLEPQSSLLSVGPPTEAVCDHPAKFSRELLSISSCLFRQQNPEASRDLAVNQEQLQISLRDSVTRLDVFRGRRLFLEERKFSLMLPVLFESRFSASEFSGHQFRW